MPETWEITALLIKPEKDYQVSKFITDRIAGFKVITIISNNPTIAGLVRLTETHDAWIIAFADQKIFCKLSLSRLPDLQVKYVFWDGLEFPTRSFISFGRVKFL